ncbi:MAG TPA: hypothetical protein DEV75_10775 [Desulfovibrio sp.]|jgi:putative spermidine/putrescine transport system ATP-binding protein|nr:hypothetical protein [Desulfovibrio sp.]
MRRSLFFRVQAGVALACCAFLVVPVAQAVLTAIMANAFTGLRGGLTTQWVERVVTLYGDTIVRSLYLGLACLAACAAIGVPAAYVLARGGSRRWVRVVEEVVVLPLSVPGLAIALGILVTWGGLTWFRQSWLFLLAGHVVFTLPFMVRSVAAVLRTGNLAELEEAAATLGASFTRRFLGVVVPAALPGIVAGSLMVLTLSIGEFNVSWMLQTPFTRTLPVGLADSYASMRLEVGSAYTLVFFVLIVPLLAGLQHAAARGDARGAATPPVDSSTGGHMSSSSVGNIASGSAAVASGVAPAGRPAAVAVTLSGCAKSYGGALVLHPFDLSVPGGSKVVLLGPSGCGKTTTLRIIAGLETPDAGGRVLFDGEDVTAVPVERRNVGMVFQHYALFPHLTVAGNVAYGLRQRRMPAPARDARVAEMLAMVHMERLADRRVQHLSGGQRQRVALARALAVRPRVLLLDEPLTALDARLRDSLREELDQLLSALGITSVFVTHDQEEAMSLGDVIVVMNGGRVEQVGSPRDIYRRPATAFVANFVGGANRLACGVDDGRLHFPGGASVALAGVPCAADAPHGPVALYFRPEHAFLARNGDGVLHGEVLTAHFLGDRSRLTVRLPGGDAVKVDVPGVARHALGETVALGLDFDACLRFAGEEPCA